VTRRDILIFLLGALTACVGVTAALLNQIKISVIALLVCSLIILVLLVLLRRQMATVQVRLLQILRKERTVGPKTSKDMQVGNSEVEVAFQISTKKVIGLLQAQQLQIDKLNARLESNYGSGRNWNVIEPES